MKDMILNNSFESVYFIVVKGVYIHVNDNKREIVYINMTDNIKEVANFVP